MKPKIAFSVCVAIPLCAFVAFLAFQAGGTCVKQGRYWTDAQLVEVAVNHLTTLSFRDLKGREWRAMQIEESPTAVAHFLKVHPNCCTVDRAPDYRSLLDVVTGWNAPEVRVTYERNRGDPHWGLEPFYTQWLAVSTCGAVLQATKGWGFKKPEAF